MIGIHSFLSFVCVISLIIGTKEFLNGFFHSVEKIINTSERVNQNALFDEDFGDSNGWSRRNIDHTLFFVFDALRYEFIAPDSSKPESNYINNFINAQKLLNEFPNNSKLIKLKSDSPTATAQRIEAIGTGIIPAYGDIMSTFSPSVVKQDTLMKQLALSDNKTFITGDDVWKYLYGEEYISRMEVFAGLDAVDIETVDLAILEKFPQMIVSEEYALSIFHFISIDHVGHALNSIDKPEMKKWQRILDSKALAVAAAEVLKRQSWQLIIVGDHGSTSAGSHGGDTGLETSTALFSVTSKPSLSIHKKLSHVFPSGRSVSHPDVTATIALTQGVPIPFASVGMFIPEVLTKSEAVRHNFVSSDMEDLAYLAYLTSLNVGQIDRYLDALSKHDFEMEWKKETLMLQRDSRRIAMEIRDFMNTFCANRDQSSPSGMTQKMNCHDNSETLENLLLEFIDKSTRYAMCIGCTLRKLWASYNDCAIGMGFAIYIATILLLLIAVKDSVVFHSSSQNFAGGHLKMFSFLPSLFSGATWVIFLPLLSALGYIVAVKSGFMLTFGLLPFTWMIFVSQFIASYGALKIKLSTLPRKSHQSSVVPLNLSSFSHADEAANSNCRLVGSEECLSFAPLEQQQHEELSERRLGIGKKLWYFFSSMKDNFIRVMPKIPSFLDFIFIVGLLVIILLFDVSAQLQKSEGDYVVNTFIHLIFISYFLLTLVPRSTLLAFKKRRNADNMGSPLLFIAPPFIFAFAAWICMFVASFFEHGRHNIAVSDNSPPLLEPFHPVLNVLVVACAVYLPIAISSCLAPTQKYIPKSYRLFSLILLVVIGPLFAYLLLAHIVTDYHVAHLNEFHNGIPHTQVPFWFQLLTWFVDPIKTGKWLFAALGYILAIIVAVVIPFIATVVSIYKYKKRSALNGVSLACNYVFLSMRDPIIAAMVWAVSPTLVGSHNQTLNWAFAICALIFLINSVHSGVRRGIISSSSGACMLLYVGGTILFFQSQRKMVSDLPMNVGFVGINGFILVLNASVLSFRMIHPLIIAAISILAIDCEWSILSGKPEIMACAFSHESNQNSIISPNNDYELSMTEELNMHPHPIKFHEENDNFAKLEPTVIVHKDMSKADYFETSLFLSEEKGNIFTTNSLSSKVSLFARNTHNIDNNNLSKGLGYSSLAVLDGDSISLSNYLEPSILHVFPATFSGLSFLLSALCITNVIINFHRTNVVTHQLFTPRWLVDAPLVAGAFLILSIVHLLFVSTICIFHFVHLFVVEKVTKSPKHQSSFAASHMNF